MVKPRKKENSTCKRRNQEEQQLDEETSSGNNGDLGNRKQKNKRSKKRENRGREESFEDSNNVGIDDNNENTVTARFLEEDKVVEMEVQVRDSDAELLGNSEDDEEDGEIPPLEGDDEESMGTENDNEDEEVEFNNRQRGSNNNATVKRPKKSTMEKIRDRGDTSDEESEEAQSMMKIAKFLEKRGYIRQVSDAQQPGTSTGTVTQQGPIDKSKKQGKHNDKVAHNASETTIYKGAVRMEIPDDNGRAKGMSPPENDNELFKRMSSSSEDGVIDTCDEQCNNEIEPITQSNLNQMQEFRLFKQFLDFRVRKSKKTIDDKPDGRSDVGQNKFGDESVRHKQVLDMVQQAEKAKACMYPIPGMRGSFLVYRYRSRWVLRPLNDNVTRSLQLM